MVAKGDRSAKQGHPFVRMAPLLFWIGSGSRSQAFPGKTDPFFPAREPLLFSGCIRVSCLLNALRDQLIVPFFAMKETPLNCTVFFRLKWPVLKNNDFYEEFCRALAALPLERLGLRSGPGTLSSEKGSGETSGPAIPCL